MTEKELLEEAKKRYPVGTIVISLHPNYNDDKMKIKNYDHCSQNKKEIYFLGDELEGSHFSRYNPLIYKDGEWAEIISYPKDYNPEQNLLKELVIW